jgi:hypothetical protein
MNILSSPLRRCVLQISDMHSGGDLGLLNPACVLIRANDDGSVEEWTPELTPTQRYLLALLDEKLGEVADWAGDDEIILLHTGDATQGDRFEEAVIAGVTKGDQRKIAASNIVYICRRLPNIKKVRLITGTLVHVPDGAEARIAADLRQTTGLDVQSAHHERINISSAVLEVAHHGPHPGTRDWTRGNVALYHLRSRIYEDRRQGVRPADAYIYGHFHQFVSVPHEDEWLNERRLLRLVVAPSMVGLGHFARKVTKSPPFITHGLVGYEITNGGISQVAAFTRTLDLRKEETL